MYWPQKELILAKNINSKCNLKITLFKFFENVASDLLLHQTVQLSEHIKFLQVFV
jgi:hypothetical protein